MWTIRAQGHANVLARHQTTWQLTKEDQLTPRGDCIIAVAADQGAVDIPTSLKEWLQQRNWVTLNLQIGQEIFQGKGQGSPSLSFQDPMDMVFRRSDYTCPRTITINTSFTARDIPRHLVEELKDPETALKLTISPINI